MLRSLRPLGHEQGGILRTEIVAKRISQTSPSEEQTSLFEEGEREHALPKTGLWYHMRFATTSVLKIPAWAERKSQPEDVCAQDSSAGIT